MVGSIICPFDTCLYNADNECQRIQTTLEVANTEDENFLNCIDYARESDNESM